METGENLGKNLKIWRFVLKFPVDLMIFPQKPGDFIKKIIFWGFDDLKLKKLEIWGFRDPPTPPPIMCVCVWCECLCVQILPL